MNSRRPKKPSHNDKAVARVVDVLARGKILKAYSPLDHEDVTVGPYHEAVDRGNRFAVIGWRGQSPQRVFRTALEAAHSFVGRVGSTRAREAAIYSGGKK